MEDNKENQDSSSLETESLDTPETEIASPASTAAAAAAPKKSLGLRARGLIGHLNIYLLLFIFIVVLAGGVVLVGVQRGKKAEAPTTITTQPLTKEDLAKLKDSEAKVGDPKQTLTIESNAIFAGKVLVRDSLDIAGTLRLGGTLAVPGLSVSGTSTFDQLQGNTLSISGDANIQGQLNVQKGINTSGAGSFGGAVTTPQLNVQSLQLSGDLQISRHITTNGGTPNRTNGTALGSGGTSSLSGSDTAGTLTVNTGGSPGAGCFATITFVQRFSETPHVVVTPVGSAAGALQHYINRNATNFSICTANAPPAGQNFSFDYIVID